MSELNAELEETSGTILETVISNIVDRYHKEHPTGGGITQEELAQAITSYFTEHPIDTVSDDDINSIIEGYFAEHPVSGGISKDDVLNIIDEYENGKNLFEVKEGTYTQDGVTVVAQNGELIINGTTRNDVEFSDIINVSDEVIWGDISKAYVCYLLNDMEYGNSDIFIEMGSNSITSYIPIIFKNDDDTSNATPILRIASGNYENVHVTPVLKIIIDGSKKTNYCEKMYAKAALFPAEIDFAFHNQHRDKVDINVVSNHNGKLNLSINGTVKTFTEVEIPVVFSAFTNAYIVHVEGAEFSVNGNSIDDGAYEIISFPPFGHHTLTIKLNPDTYDNKAVSIKFVGTMSLEAMHLRINELTDATKQISAS